MDIRITEEESILAQLVSMSALITALSTNNFLQSDFYNQMCLFGDSHNRQSCEEKNAELCVREILKKSGEINPATVQMLLYALIVIPKELLANKNDYEKCIDLCAHQVNDFASKFATKKSSTYKDESDDDINYYKHIRNALAHSKCTYTPEGNALNYITFQDINMKDKSQHCEIEIPTYALANLVISLQAVLLAHLNIIWETRKSLK